MIEVKIKGGMVIDENASLLYTRQYSKYTCLQYFWVNTHDCLAKGYNDWRSC